VGKLWKSLSVEGRRNSSYRKSNSKKGLSAKASEIGGGKKFLKGSGEKRAPFRTVRNTIRQPGRKKPDPLKKGRKIENEFSEKYRALFKSEEIPHMNESGGGKSKLVTGSVKGRKSKEEKAPGRPPKNDREKKFWYPPKKKPSYFWKKTKLGKTGSN